jgi:hypothetical protein
MPEAKMTTMRLSKNLSEDVVFPSLFLVLDAKGGEGDLPLLAFYIFLGL